MIVTMTNVVTDQVGSMDLDITPEQWAMYESGEGLVQDIFPNLNADEREFLISGMTPGQWDEIFGDEDE